MIQLPNHKSSTLVQVGDRVLVRFGTRSIRAEVIEDLGGIGVGGRQIVRVKALEPTDGEREEFEVAADELN
ncbi:MAG: hypothetical protein OEU09_18080 [Rhodospirillales bacterium]|nr:hypothetical protein [Rhodospirillales bacterium]MDH3790900.1 hypothetical protein [Rhodospirillales bacterium]MDH3913198.1 hypothetical protein [Rhodospirillales bacterium]MDH3920802.1 hypothetical protein [Rhodospirillales bacterium]MDH3966205.1 hypothetical protein [Rhodospirillales bacterium]